MIGGKLGSRSPQCPLTFPTQVFRLLVATVKLRDECLNEHVFSTLAEARCIIEAWRIDYNTERPHSSLGYLTPEEFAASWRAAGEKETAPDATSRPATGRAAAVCGASASQPIAGTPAERQSKNGLNL